MGRLNNGGTEHGSLWLYDLCLPPDMDKNLVRLASSPTIWANAPIVCDQFTAPPNCPKHAAANLMARPQNRSWNCGLGCPGGKCTYQHAYVWTWCLLWSIHDEHRSHKTPLGFWPWGLFLPSTPFQVSLLLPTWALKSPSRTRESSYHLDPLGNKTSVWSFDEHLGPQSWRATSVGYKLSMHICLWHILANNIYVYILLSFKSQLFFHRNFCETVISQKCWKQHAKEQMRL